MGHRPTTRSKNKRRRPDEDADTTPQILRKIHYSGEVTKDDFKNLYMIWKPVCQGCRVNTKDNPNCFCGLVPHPNGNRKSGLWQKQSEIIHSLGPDPCNDIRASHDSPAGLTNLGATCYANSILQCLYMNKSFREGVFSIEPDLLKQHPVLNQLARLFAQLHVSKMASVDSASFIETLKLDNAIQQDSHEFLTLLLSLLERCLRDSKVSKARTVVQDLFRGSVSHVTRCSKCGKDSPASSNIEDFYDLELNVKGLKSLDESLNDYLSLEELNGENQYYCDSCNTRVDATRYIKLRTLPDVLNFQLKRYIFLPKTAEKKKITSAFCFPGELAMGQRMHEPSQSELIYDLSAVLLHKGTAVNSGHYIAHIKDENTGQWWKFDDEDVSNFGCHPLGEASPISTAKSVQNESSHLSCTEPRSTDVDGNNINASDLQSFKSNNIKNIETFSSCDAYMLRYNIRRRKMCDKTHTDCGGETMEIEDNVVSPNNDVACPSYLSEGIMELNASYIASCEEYKLKKERKLKHVTERRQEVRSILSEAPVLSQEDPYFWISTDWLREWADSISVGAIDNTSIQCLHGKVPVSKAGSMKRLSHKAWTLLHSKHGGGPILSNDDYCSSCLIDGANSIISADSYREKRTMMKELAEAALAGNIFDGTLYYVSRPWLQQWVRRKNIDSPCEADAGPTGSIRCIHGDLLPERAVGARNQHHVLVPENLWLFFYERANAVKPDDSRDCWAFPSDSRPCAQCSVEYQEAASLEVNLRMVKLKQRQNHEKLAQGKGIALSSNCGYYLLPSLWLSNWRSYVNATGKNASLSVEPDPLDIVINSLKCEEHSLLLERPLDLTYKRGSVFQRVSTTDGLTIITESDWKLFCEEWGGTEENGIYAEIEFNGLTNNLVCSCEEFPILDGHLSPDGTTDGNESKQPVIKTTPEICEDCIGEKERCELKRKQNYCNECIRVCFVRGKNAPKSVIEASGTSDLDRRTSKRSRKTNFGNSVNLEVSGSTTIYQLKLMIWESFGVIKENQVLCKGSGPITGEEAATLADMNIFPGDTLWITDSEIHEHRDIAEELLNHNVDVQHSGEGFQGTLLTSNASSVVA